MMERAALYARVSTTRQEEERTVSSQLDALLKAAEDLGVPIPSERRYVDDGYSGSRLDRPALDALRDAAADGLIDLVLVFAPDRLARNYVHQQVVLDELARRGVRVHFLERPMSERAEDKLLVQMQGVIAEYERAKILERTRRGRLHKVRSGQNLPFTIAPYGYRIIRSPEGKRRVVIIDEMEATHVRAMYRWAVEEDLSARAIAKRLNAQGVRPRRGRFWMVTSIHRILTNPAYAGMAIFGKMEPAEPIRPRKPGKYRKNAKSSSRPRPRAQWMTVPVPAIIDQATQSDVRARLARNKKWSPRNVQYEYLLRNLVVCAECGWRKDCVRSSEPGTQRLYYICKKHDPADTGRAQPCRARWVRATELDRVVWEALCAWLRTPQMLNEEVSAWQQSQQGAEASAREQARLQAACHQLQGQIERLIDAYQQGAIDVQELKARREKLEASLEATRVRADELAAQHSDRSRLEQLHAELETFAATVREGLDALDFAGRQRLVRLLICRRQQRSEEF